VTRAVTDVFESPLPIIAVMHLPPLPGYAEHPGMSAVLENALAQLEAIEAAGMDGVLVENEYDLPHRFEPGPECVAAFAIVCHEVAKRARIPMGGEILAHHPRGSFAAVKAAGGRFIRTDFFVDRVRIGDGRVIDVDPGEILAYRSHIDGDGIALWTDIQVKYSTMVEPKPIEQSAREAQAAGSDGVVVTGTASGDPPTIEDLRAAKRGTSLPVIIGSGLDAGNALDLLVIADAALVGTSLKTGRMIDHAKAGWLMEVVAGLRAERGSG
jgi:membrane complex biogenesis BtpA family protein